MLVLDRIALLLTIIGAVNWGLIGVFQFDLVAFVCGGQGAVISRIIYSLVGLAGLWCVSLLFRERDEARQSRALTLRRGSGRLRSAGAALFCARM